MSIAVRIFFVLAVLVLRAVSPLPPLAAPTEEAPSAMLEVEVETDAEDDTPVGDSALAHESPLEVVERDGTPPSRDADGPDEPPLALADRPPNV